MVGSPEEIRTPVAGSKANEIKIEDMEDTVSKFIVHCKINERLEKSVYSHYKWDVKRFLLHSSGIVSPESLRSYLATYLDKSPKSYNNQLDGLRAFIKRFLGRPEIIKDFKKAHYYNYCEVKLPTKKQLRIGFQALTDDRERAMFLFYATTGLRRSELLNLKKSDVDFESRSVKSKHNTRTKKAGVTFYNEECDKYLCKYLDSRKDEKEKLFRIGYREFTRIWKKASGSAKCKITAQILRKWHSTELGELGVPDRFVDVFQGRAPRNVLAKYYTGKDLMRLVMFR